MNQLEAKAIAHAVAFIRPQWLTASLETLLARLPRHYRDRPARDVHLALLWLAYDPEQETPRLLREDGPWWNLGRLVDKRLGITQQPPRHQPDDTPRLDPATVHAYANQARAAAQGRRA